MGVIIFLLHRKWQQIKDSEVERVVIVEAIKERQAETKKRLLESKLKKQLADYGRGIWRKIEEVIRSINSIKRITSWLAKRANVLKLSKATKVERKTGEIGVVSSKLLEAQVFMKKRQIDKAEDKYVEVLQDDPKNVDAYMALGKIYAMRKDWQTAEEAYRYILKIDHTYYEGHRELCNVFKQQKKWSELKGLCQELIVAGKQEAWVFVNMGLVYKKTGYPEKAEEYFKRAVEIEPQNEALLDYLIEVAIINKNKLLALKCLNTLLGVSNDALKLQGYRDKIDII